MHTGEETDTAYIDVKLEGGSGKAYIKSPVRIEKSNGITSAVLVWSSENYDYMIVDGNKYMNETPGEASTFTVPVRTFEEPLVVLADTVAMSSPHEIEYTLIWGQPYDLSQGEAIETGDVKSVDHGFGTRPGESSGLLVNKKEMTGKMPLSYAEGFDIMEYDEYRLIRIYGVGDYLLVPEGSEIPEVTDANLKEVNITILQQPLDHTYLVSTSVMDLVRQIGALDMVKMSGTKASDWSVTGVAELMEEGKILYAGKYRTPDYELLLENGCNLAVENTMIYHNPQVKEKLEELGIPVMVETSGYEKDPRGRLEWIKLYGTVYNREEEAVSFYSRCEKKISSVTGSDKTDKKVAFFSVSAAGVINIRKQEDYIANLIELAGGNYVPRFSGTDSGTSGGTMNIQPEDFYAGAADADILIYNSTIEGEIGSVDELIQKNGIFRDFKAVKEENVYCMKSDLFQHPTDIAGILSDMREIIEGYEIKQGCFEKLK